MKLLKSDISLNQNILKYLDAGFGTPSIMKNCLYQGRSQDFSKGRSQRLLTRLSCRIIAA